MIQDSQCYRIAKFGYRSICPNDTILYPLGGDGGYDENLK
jgi:hypothetical protein